MAARSLTLTQETVRARSSILLTSNRQEIREQGATGKTLVEDQQEEATTSCEQWLLVKILA